MSRAKAKKNYWYVLVLTDKGPVFVTSVEYSPKVAYWNKKEVPKEFGEAQAKDLAMGLSVNGFIAYPICNFYDLETQPYYYNKGHFEWVEGEEETDEQDS